MHACAGLPLCYSLNNVFKTNVVKGFIFLTYCCNARFLLIFQFQEKPSVDMESINIQIEPCKTYFSDGCVESVRADETELLGEHLKIESDEPVSIFVLLMILLLGIFIHYFVSVD